MRGEFKNIFIVGSKDEMKVFSSKELQAEENWLFIQDRFSPFMKYIENPLNEYCMRIAVEESRGPWYVWGGLIKRTLINEGAVADLTVTIYKNSADEKDKEWSCYDKNANVTWCIGRQVVKAVTWVDFSQAEFPEEVRDTCTPLGHWIGGISVGAMVPLFAIFFTNYCSLMACENNQ